MPHIRQNITPSWMVTFNHIKPPSPTALCTTRTRWLYRTSQRHVPICLLKPSQFELTQSSPCQLRPTPIHNAVTLTFRHAPQVTHFNRTRLLSTLPQQNCLKILMLKVNTPQTMCRRDSDTGTSEYSKNGPIRRKLNQRDAKLPDTAARQRSTGSAAQGEATWFIPSSRFLWLKCVFCY